MKKLITIREPQKKHISKIVEVFGIDKCADSRAIDIALAFTALHAEKVLNQKYEVSDEFKIPAIIRNPKIETFKPNK